MKKIILGMLALFFFSAGGNAATTGRDSAYHLYLRALIHETQGNLTQAQSDLEKALELAPNSAYLHRAMADLSFRTGQFKKAVEAIERANELDPDDVKGFILAGQIYFSLGESDKAEAKLKKALNLAPDELEALVNLATTVAAKDPQRAINLYTGYLERHPGEVAIRERVAQLYQAQGDAENAKKTWEKVLEWSPASLKAHLALAQIAEVNQDTMSAISHYEAVLTQDPFNLALLLRMGELRYRNNDMAQAYEAFNRARSIAPGSTSANFWLALLSEQQGNWEEAIRLLEQVSESVNEPGVLLRLSYYYSQVGRYKEAISALKKLTALEPSNVDFLMYLAMAYEQDKQLAEAEKTLKLMIQLDPEKPEPYFHIATLYDRMNRFKNAEAALKTAISLKPDYHIALNYLGYSYADRNINLEAAERLVNNAVALSPQNGAYLDSMGWVYYRQGKFQKAVDFLTQATAQARDPLIWEHLGDAKRALGQMEDAILAWDESLRIEPGKKDLASKTAKSLREISKEALPSFLIERAAIHFGHLRALDGVVQPSICKGKKCFDFQAQLHYGRDEELTVEVPGPLGAPLFLFSLPEGGSAEFGSIHATFQSYKGLVEKSFKRLNALLSADVFERIQDSERSDTVKSEIKGNSLDIGTDNLTVRFSLKDGRATNIRWKEAGGEADQLELSLYGASQTLYPDVLTWEEDETKYRIRLKLARPALIITPLSR